MSKDDGGFLPDPKNPFDPRWKLMLDREKTLKEKPRDSRRDIMLHAAVTIRNTRKGFIVPMEQDNEIGQYAGEFLFDKIPVPETYVRQAWKDLAENCIARMRAYGLIK